MTARHDPATTRTWMRAGTAELLARTEQLTDAELVAPSALPGWTRAHLLGHVARNAEALTRLATWARTGVQTPMYAGPEQRTVEIEASAAFPPARLRRELAGTATQLDAALDALDRWDAPVRSALGRAIPAAEIPWMRVREVWLHAVDLDAGATTPDLPDEVLDTLLDDVVATLSARGGCPPASLEPADRDRAWVLGAGGGPIVRAPAHELAGWLTGRGRPPPGAPTAPRWL